MVGGIKSNSNKINNNRRLQALDITDDNYDDIVGKKKYVLVKFYTKWCRFCQLLSPEYDKLVDIFNNTRKDVVIGRLDAGANDITATKYGINQFPIVALFFPGSQRIVDVYQGMRQSEHMANWLNHACPKIEIEENEEKNNDKKEKNEESLEIDMEKINKKNEITEKKEFIKARFFELQKYLDIIEQNIDNITNNTNSKHKSNFRRHKRLRITFDFNLTNIFITGITLLIIFAFYQTGRKLLINSGFHKD